MASNLVTFIFARYCIINIRYVRTYYHVGFSEESHMDNKKKYVKPVAETVDFEAGDIITYSTHGTAPDDWEETPGAEDWGGNN